jgi:hypothetical protein
MRLMLLLGLALIVLVHTAPASTDTNAITTSFLVSNTSDSSSLQTISSHIVNTPDLDLSSQSMIETDLGMLQGTSETKQALYFSSDNTPDFNSIGMMRYSFNGTNILSIDSKMNCNGIFQKLCSPGSVKVASSSLSLGLVDPGSNNYTFAMVGNYNVTNINSITPDPSWAPEDSKEFSVSLVSSPLLLEEPADFVKESADLQLWVDPEDIGIQYDSDRDMVIGDTSFHSDVTLVHIDSGIT